MASPWAGTGHQRPRWPRPLNTGHRGEQRHRSHRRHLVTIRVPGAEEGRRWPGMTSSGPWSSSPASPCSPSSSPWWSSRSSPGATWAPRTVTCTFKGRRITRLNDESQFALDLPFTNNKVLFFYLQSIYGGNRRL